MTPEAAPLPNPLPARSSRGEGAEIVARRLGLLPLLLGRRGLGRGGLFPSSQILVPLAKISSTCSLQPATCNRPRRFTGFGLALLLLMPFYSSAQPGSPIRTQDPLMQLMLAQPKIDMDSPVAPAVVFDPPVVKPGETAVYRVTLNALETAIEWPERIPAPQGLACRPGGHGQILAMAGGLLAPRTTFNYRVTASKAGTFAIPEFTVKVNGKSIAIPAAQLQVTATLPPGALPAQQLFLDLPTNNLFVGQTVAARVVFPGSPRGMIQSLGQVQLNGQGFIVDQSSARARIEALPLGPEGGVLNAFVYEMSFTPIAIGKLSVFAQGYAVGNRVIGGIILPNPGAGANTLPQYTLIDSEPVVLWVRPLPAASQLPGFTGAVGIYSVDPPELATNLLSVGEPVQLKVKVRSEGNLARLVPPPAPQVSDWQIFPAQPDNTPPQILQAQGHVTFTYTLIPLSEKAKATPAFPFSTFDPERGAYTDLTVPGLGVTVLPGHVSAADLQSVLQAEKLDRDAEKEPVLSGLAVSPGLAAGMVPVQQRAWFPLLHLVPGAALLTLWLWDRRRRFLEQHPAIVLRRRALRALRRERRVLDRAARSRDSSGFAAVAVNAMKIAVAPHYPAEPRALVGADVLSMMPENQRSGPPGQLVRDLFSRTDAAQFATAPAAAAELLDCRPQVEAVLDDLEARLCC